MKVIIIENKYTGNQYAYPADPNSNAPCLGIEMGCLRSCGFHRYGLTSMLDSGHARVIGEADLQLVLSDAVHL